MNAIEVRGLTKSYGDVHAVRGLDLTVGQGEIFGFLGPNGAGKTTTIEILEGFRERTGGDVRVLGQDPATAPLSWREDIGIVLQESEIEGELTAREAVTMQSAYFSAPRNPDEVLELVGLADARDQRAAKLSGGQKRRLDLAMALVGDPKLVFLDEPTTGFDPSARRESWDMISALRDLGNTVLLTTHYMDEAQNLADRIAVVASGQIVAKGTADELAEQVAAVPRITWSAAPSPSAPTVPDRFGAVVDGDRMVIETHDVVTVLNELTNWATDPATAAPGGTASHVLVDLEIARPTLEDTYLRLTASPDGATAPPADEPTGGSKRRSRGRGGRR